MINRWVWVTASLLTNLSPVTDRQGLWWSKDEPVNVSRVPGIGGSPIGVIKQWMAGYIPIWNRIASKSIGHRWVVMTACSPSFQYVNGSFYTDKSSLPSKSIQQLRTVDSSWMSEEMESFGYVPQKRGWVRVIVHPVGWMYSMMRPCLVIEMCIHLHTSPPITTRLCNCISVLGFWVPEQ